MGQYRWAGLRHRGHPTSRTGEKRRLEMKKGTFLAIRSGRKATDDPGYWFGVTTRPVTKRSAEVKVKRLESTSSRTYRINHQIPVGLNSRDLILKVDLIVAVLQS